MAYQSDIDLATLHKKRLDEKNNYKLSWYNRRFYDDEMSHHHHHHHQQHITLKSEEHKVKSKVGTKSSKSKINTTQPNTKTSSSSTSSACVKPARASNDVNNDIAHDAVANKSSTCNPTTNRNRSPDFYDEGYFSSPTLNRRRSGTWP